MTQRATFALVVERDVGLRNHWAERLRLAGQARVLRRARPAEAEPLIDPDGQLTAVVVGLSAQGPRDASMLELVRAVRRMSPGTVILAVDHGRRGGTPAEAFGAGVDDYLRLDNHRAEFDARLAARLRSALPLPGTGAIDYAALGLTPLEERILTYLYERAGEIVTRSALAQELGETDWTYGDRRFDVHIARIRRKLKKRHGERVQVTTVRSKGYMLEDEG